METYCITEADKLPAEALYTFTARHQAEAILEANEFDERNELAGTILWVRTSDGWDACR